MCECDAPHETGDTVRHGTDRPLSRLVSDGGRRFDEAFAVLADRQRRYALYYLREEEHASLPDVASRIAAWERDCAVDDVSDDARADLEMRLYHKHLPKLQEGGVVEYDDRSETMVLDEPSDLVERCLEYCAPRELPE